MHSYYAFATMRLPFPNILKRNLTRLQITQFLIGGSLAASYLFIKLPDVDTSKYLSSLQNAQLETFNFSAQLEAARGQFASTADRAYQIRDQCLVNPAQRTAVLLNVIYLLPLSECQRSLSLFLPQRLTITIICL